MALLTTSPLIKTYTLEEFWELPEPPDGSKIELIAGVLYMTPPPESPHNFTAANLVRLFTLHLEAIGNPGWLFVPRAALWTSPGTYVEPDLFFISAETVPQMDLTRPDRADLVVEILSPGTEVYDRRTKADTYGALGVHELWLVDPVRETIEVRLLDTTIRQYGPGELFRTGRHVHSTVLPGFLAQVEEIFRRPEPRGGRASL